MINERRSGAVLKSAHKFCAFTELHFHPKNVHIRTMVAYFLFFFAVLASVTLTQVDVEHMLRRAS